MTETMKTTERPYNVLFLCTGNSARSIMAECLLNALGGGRFRAHSAGSTPAGRVHPQALRLLRRFEHPVEELRSKSWDEFTDPGAPKMHFIVTVCANAAGEVCPIWPGRPASAHWPVPDPAAHVGTEAEVAAAFEAAYRRLKARIGEFVRLPAAELDRLAARGRGGAPPRGDT